MGPALAGQPLSPRSWFGVYFCSPCGGGCVTWALAGQPKSDEPSWGSLFPG